MVVVVIIIVIVVDVIVATVAAVEDGLHKKISSEKLNKNKKQANGLFFVILFILIN